ncbi:dermonecrotic toxin domain-containing protein [Pseudomonas sp. COR18]|uniref:dermonecrotic toxin domain-containing protein n=1 Tax=Pseudomonas sp. COR18 TaxID=3399680 RepID=UPI003AFF673C
MESLQQDPASTARTAVLPAPDSVLLKRFEERLFKYLAASRHPSLSLNRLQAALTRALESQHELGRLLERAPQIGTVLGQRLREAFGHDPRRLLFSVPAGMGSEQPERSLVQVALSMLRNPFLSLEAGTRLTLAGEPDSPLALTPDQALVRLKTLGLASSIAASLHDYWQQPAQGSSVSRRERLVELHKRLFHDKGLLAHGLGVLSATATAMLMGLLDAPSAQARALAGARWAKLAVSELAWPGVGQAAPLLGGALHLWSSGSDTLGRRVVYVPGVAEEFFEFTSMAELQRELPRHLNAPGNYSAWQLLPLQERHHLFGQTDRAALPYGFLECPPLADDALAHSALARLDTQLASEWAAALSLNVAYLLPQLSTDAVRLAPLQAVEVVQQSRGALARLPAIRPLLARLLRSDERHRMLAITFGSLSDGIPQRLRQGKVREQERGLLKLLEPTAVAVPKVLLDDHEPWQQQVARVRELLRDRDGYARASFWSDRDEQGVELSDRLLDGRCQALLHEARMQRQLGLLQQPELERLLDVLPGTSRAALDTRVASIAVGAEDSSWTLTGACVISTQQALADPQLNTAALLFVPGRLGGLAVFVSLENLSQQLGQTLLDPECETLWPLIARDRRGALRDGLRQLAPGEPVPVHYRAIPADALWQGLRQQIQEHLRICRAIEGGLRPFSEIGDARSSLQMLAHELQQSLGVPEHDARERALENVAALQLTAAQARELPAWLAQAAFGRRQQYARLLRSYQLSAQALAQRLEQRLPDLDDFARGKIVERLRRDGFHPGLEIDKPLFDLPDSVERVWVGHPENPVGGAGPKTQVSEQRRRYSFLQLALENLDPQAPATRLRLQQGRILDPAWQQRLTPDYLISTISTLDLGGQYDTLIQRAFYSVDDPRNEAVPVFERALLDRLVRQRARLELFSARQQGLGEQAAQLFERALGDRPVSASRHDTATPELYFVTFAGRAFAKARHVGNAVAIRDRVSNLTLVYLPGAPHAQVLTEYPDLQAAQRALVDSGQALQRVDDIAQRLAVGWAEQVIAEYPSEPMPAAACPQAGPAPAALTEPLLTVRPGWLFKVIKSWWNSEVEQPFPGPEALKQEVRHEIGQNPGHWLRLERTPRSDLALILGHAIVLRAQQRARVVSNSSRQLAQQREVHEREQRWAYWLRVLSVVPVASIAVNIRESAVALRQFHRSGDPRDAFELFKAVHMTLIDVAPMVFPLAAGARPARAALGSWARAALKSISRRRTLYEKGAAALKRLDAGRHPAPVLPGYAASIPGEDGVLLHGPTNAGSQVKNGVQFISDGVHRYEVYRPKGEQALRLKKTAAQPNELILYIRESGEHLLRADAPEPQPGPSRGPFHRPWEARPAPPPAPAPILRPEWMSRRPAAPAASWKHWGLTLAEDEVVELPTGQHLYRRRGSDARLLKLDDRFFELLADGSDIEPEIVFIRRPGPLADLALSDFEHWWSHLDQQPIPVSFDPRTGVWTPRAPLFDAPGRELLAPLTGRMTTESRARTLNRLIERSETGGNPTVTASRMVALKRTLETWGTRGVDLHVLFRELEGRSARRFFRIGLPDGEAGFSRLDFEPAHVINPHFFEVGGRHRVMDLSLHTERAVKDVLLRHGFVVNEIPKGRSFLSVNLDCTHPGSEHRYLLLLKWTRTEALELFRSRGAPVQLTDDWLRRLVDSRSISHSDRLQPARAALEQGRLVKLVAGLQRVPDSQRIVVFFIRVA